MEPGEAFDLIARAIDAGRAAHGYLIAGDLRGGCAELVDRLLRHLFPDAPDLAASGEHPDVVRLEPQGRSRTIKVQRGKEDNGPGMRDGMIEPMSATAFSGGWKVGIVVGADRMQPEAANAFLKSLEEPGRTPSTSCSPTSPTPYCRRSSRARSASTCRRPRRRSRAMTSTRQDGRSSPGTPPPSPPSSPPSKRRRTTPTSPRCARRST
ncbi:MAG: hypothetical protein IKE55_02330 [Kiritimatiellae bacterium]|nr:hypothetical protein [Kiritimatiellia bacterium]